MSTIFDLKTSVDQLTSSNLGIGSYKYTQRAPSRDVTTTNFPQGTIYIRWSNSGQNWTLLKNSYLRLRITLSDAAGNALELSDYIAPSQGLCAHLFQSAEFLINGTVVSRIDSQLPQIDAIQTRLTKSKSWLDSVGAETNFWQSTFKERSAAVSSDGDQILDPPHTDSIIAGAGIGQTLTFLDLTTPNQVQFVAATATVDGYAIFTANGGTVIPDLRRYFKPGQYVAINDGVEKVKLITEVTANRIYMSGEITAQAAGDLIAQVRSLNLEDNKARRVKDFEVLWKPPLSVFGVDQALPVGNYELRLVPQPSSIYRELSIESIKAAKSAGAGNDFLLSVNEMYLYTADIQGTRVDDITYYLDLNETRCSYSTIDNNTSLQQKEFNVSPSTYALTLAFQDNAVDTDSRYCQSRFKIGGDGSETELALSRYYIQYGNETKPSPDSLPEFTSESRDYTVENYYRNLVESGCLFDQGGCETLKDWRDRGAYYHLLFPRDGTDRNTRVQCNYQFSSAPGTPRVLLFSHYKKVAKVRIENGVVVDVLVEEV